MKWTVPFYRALTLSGVSKSAALFVAGVMSIGSIAQAQDKTIKADGSSTVAPVTVAVAEQFQAENKGIKVTVGVSGTGGGMKKFVRGELDIANASRPIKPDEVKAAKEAGIDFVELPVAFDALTVVINKDNAFAKTMTVADLKKIWSPDAQDKVKTWKDVRPEWPDTPLKLFGPGADSGTFEYFTEAIVGKAKSSRADFTPSEDDNVLVQGVVGDKGGLGYFGMAYYLANKDKLTAVAIDNGKGKAVLPTEDAVADGTYLPLSRPIFIYINKKSLDSKPEVKQFAEFYMKKGPEFVSKVKYVPLPDTVYEKNLEKVAKGTTGTIFGDGHAIGVSIKDLLERQPK